MGKYKVPHFDAKGEADRIFRELGVPTTFLLTAFYWENLIYFGMGPQRGPDGTLAITFPMDDKKLPSIAVEDIGKAALGIFKRGREFINKTVGIAGEHLTGAQMAAASPGPWARRCATTMCRPRCIGASAFPARTIWATCSSSSATSRILLRCAQPRVHPVAQSGAADVRPVAGEEQGADPAPGRSTGLEGRRGSTIMRVISSEARNRRGERRSIGAALADVNPPDPSLRSG